jgi:hypothetical protein
MNPRLLILLIIVALMGVVHLKGAESAIGSKSRQDEVRFDGSLIHHGEKIRVMIAGAPFLADDHRISSQHWKIDGTTPTGVDAFEVTPKSEIRQFHITWNGHEIPMPRELYSDCYNPDLRPSDATHYRGAKRKPREGIAGEGTMLRWDDTSNELEIIMVSCKWASAPYFVIWRVTPHGVRSREVVLLGS